MNFYEILIFIKLKDGGNGDTAEEKNQRQISI